MKKPMIRPPLYCAWTSNQFSCSRKLDNRSPQPKTIPSASTMSTNGPVRRVFSCSQHLYLDFARRRLVLSE